jgi:hypothetical protein
MRLVTILGSICWGAHFLLRLRARHQGDELQVERYEIFSRRAGGILPAGSGSDRVFAGKATPLPQHVVCGIMVA